MSETLMSSPDWLRVIIAIVAGIFFLSILLLLSTVLVTASISLIRLHIRDIRMGE